MVNLEWYRTFKAVYNTQTMTAAAEALFISQPGVSLHLSSLESYVGSRLFDRVAKKMIPTEQGKVLYNAISEPLSKLEEVEKRFQKSTELEVPTINIGMCFETFQHILERHLHTLDFNIISSFSGYQNLLRDLEKGLIDIVITPTKIDIKGVKYVPIGVETIVLIGGRDIDKTAFTSEIKKSNNAEILALLKQNKWYGTSSDNEHFKRFWLTNFKALPDFRANYIVPNFKSIINSLSYGRGLAIVPDFLCRNEIEKGKLQLLWKGATPITNTLYFAYRNKSIFEAQVKEVLNIFQSDMNKNI
ncbi:LysR family transcriptional regulator [Saccharicrinis aurantiacus]|uniref:LysR family transcriptional regulator n=1 Tax=Saccharicrinis aurantiacus TaxID=1849719 RepID=UPI0024933A60|nr:LysR family transcriptional regulator [Saccharicrinis aurantiacus]